MSKEVKELPISKKELTQLYIDETFAERKKEKHSEPEYHVNYTVFATSACITAWEDNIAKSEHQHSGTITFTDTEQKEQKQEPPTATTIFGIGSVTKMFTAATMLSMTEEYSDKFTSGIDSKLKDFIPALKAKYPDCKFIQNIESQKDFDQITLRDILVHDSGLKGEDARKTHFEKLFTDPDHNWTLSEIVDSDYQAAQQLGYKQHKYSNFGYAIAAMVIEATAPPGKTYANMVNELVIDKIGLKNTFTHDRVEELLATKPQQVAHGQFAAADGKMHEGNGYKHAIGSGCMYSTAEDLNIFKRAFLTQNKKYSLFTQENTIKAMALTEDDLKRGYGLGFGMAPRGHPNKSLGHNGGINGFACDVRYDPTTDIAYTILTATQDFGLRDRVTAIRAEISKEKETKEDNLAPVNSALKEPSASVTEVFSFAKLSQDGQREVNEIKNKLDKNTPPNLLDLTGGAVQDEGSEYGIAAKLQANRAMMYDALRGATLGFHILGEVRYSSTGKIQATGAKDLFDMQNPPVAPDQNTQFTIGSIQKSFAAACSLLKLWDTELTQARSKQAKPEEQKESDPQQAATLPLKWFPQGIETPISHFMESLKERFGNKVLGAKGCDEFFSSVEQDIRLAQSASKTITIRDLLNHTHGFGVEDKAKCSEYYRGNQPFELYDLVNTFVKGGDTHGTPHYGNVSIALASMIAEIAGRDISAKDLTFEDVVDKYVRIPCKLEEHTSLSRDTQSLYTTAGTNTSRGFGFDETIDEELDGNVERYKGGVKSSAQGLVSYARQYLTGEMFTNEEVREAVTGRKNQLKEHMKDKNGDDTGVTYHLGISANRNIPNRLNLCAGGACSHTSLTFDSTTREVNVTLQVLHGFSDHVAKSIFAERYPEQKAALDQVWQKLSTIPGATDRLDPEYYNDVDKCLIQYPNGLEALKLYQSIYDKVQTSYTPQQLKTKSEPDDSEHNRKAQTPTELMRAIKEKVIASPDLPESLVLQKQAQEEKGAPEASSAVTSAVAAAPDLEIIAIKDITKEAEKQMKPSPSNQHLFSNDIQR